jgi:hypothetical protein
MSAMPAQVSRSTAKYESQRRRRRPRHGEHHVQGDTEFLGHVDMPVAGWIGDDGVGSEARRAVSFRVGRRARPPARLDDLLEHLALLRHVLDDLVEPRRQQRATRLHHVRDEFFGVAAQGIELEVVRLDELAKDGVRRQPHPMAVPQQALSDGDEGLDVAPGSGDEDGDLERRRGRADADRRRRALEAEVPVLTCDTLHLVGRAGAEVDLDAVIDRERDGADRLLGELARTDLQQAVAEERSRRFFTACRHVPRISDSWSPPRLRVRPRHGVRQAAPRSRCRLRSAAVSTPRAIPARHRYDRGSRRARTVRPCR